jgi:hypothetical protein
MNEVLKLIELLKKKKIDSFSKDIHSKLIFLFDSLNKESFRETIILLLQNYENLNTQKKKFVEMRTNSILSSINAQKYINKEDFLFCKLYTYSTEYVLYVKEWNDKIIEILDNTEKNWKKMEIKYLYNEKYEKLENEDIVKTLKEKTINKKNFKIRLIRNSQPI